MKISKRQLRRIIRESLQKRFFDEIQNWVFNFDDGSGAVHVDQLIPAWERDYPDLPLDELWGALEIMEDAGDLRSEGSSGYYRFID